MIYEKAGIRYPDSRRYNAVFEYMFILSKGKPKTIHLIADRINLYSGDKVARKSQIREIDGTLSSNSAYRNNKNKIIKKIGVRNNIWRYSSGKENAKGRLDHPAQFPEQLALDHIISWSNENDVILDPMMGSGTTGVVSVKTGRNFIGCDVSHKYFNMAEKRIHDAQMQQPLPFATQK